MKKILLPLCIIAVLAACNNTPDGFTINGAITGDIENGTQVFLKKTDERNQPVNLDTTTIENGKFVFKGISSGIELQFLFIDKIQGYIPFVIENGEIEISAQKDSLAFAKIEGTLQNELFADYSEGSKALSKRVMAINEDLKKANSSRDEATAASLKEEYLELQEEGKNFELNYVKENPNALISAFLIERIIAQKALPEDEVKVLYDALTPEIKETKPGKSIKEKLEKEKNTSIGSKAPNFSAPTPTGEQLALNNALGKVTIVDFWAAWCKPCRAENPNVVKIYNQFHEKGLNILGVSLDRKAEDWKKAIEDDGLVWNHVSNVQYFDEIAKLYNVNAIPATFILDENGVIVAKNLRGSALEEKIASMLQ